MLAVDLNVESLRSRAMLLLQIGRFDEALLDLDIVLKLQQQEDAEWIETARLITDALFRQAQTAKQSNQVDQAIAAYDAIIGRFASSSLSELGDLAAEAMLDKGKLLLLRGRFEEMRDTMDSFDELFPFSLALRLVVRSWIRSASRLGVRFFKRTVHPSSSRA